MKRAGTMQQRLNPRPRENDFLKGRDLGRDVSNTQTIALAFHGNSGKSLPIRQTRSALTRQLIRPLLVNSPLSSAGCRDCAQRGGKSWTPAVMTKTGSARQLKKPNDSGTTVPHIAMDPKQATPDQHRLLQTERAQTMSIRMMPHDNI